jgi:hypothetical protein
MRIRAIVTLSLTLGCGVGASSGDDEATQETGESTASDDRGSSGKADDPTGRCASDDKDFCGGQSDGGCWCDDECESFGDCCTDRGTVCGGEEDECIDPATCGPDPEPEPPVCRKNAVLMGYWPPTNEMLRPFSTNELQNPGGWVGENWRGHGYDVYSFFPEFPPDGDPTNDDIGDDGAVGSPDFDLRVDYQATSADFWRIVDEHEPVVLITTSRGGDIGWEIEAIEGGHGIDNPGDPSRDWRSDRHGDEHFPTQASIEPRSWDAISEFRQGVTLSTALPVDVVFEAASALDLTSVAVDETGTSGNFLSGFLGLHGLYYSLVAQHDVAAGHIHVGFGMPTATARELIEATLEAVLLHHIDTQTSCP